ncbi:hypothetical protein VTK73DRAFT_4699 [Phialemonium thermophilum]|uniref:Casein kinase II beta 2 subunit n=1 Tax=Phialemonium thermophilum TaxID=223376 RepID=A0ABR3WSJ8_9PEZI
MSPTGGIWAPLALRVLRKAVAGTSKMVRAKLAAATRPLGTELQPVAARASPSGGRQPIHPAAFIRQQKRANWYSTTSSANLVAAVRRRLSTFGAQRTRSATSLVRFKYPVSNISRTVSQLTGRAPFASTLRPNLTGGALPRTAGGYATLGAGRAGGQRYFSHTPAAPAQVVQNVSQAMRAFWLSGQRARFDGVDAKGSPRFRSVTVAQENARIRLAAGIPSHAPGSYIEFRTSPTITALGPLGVNSPSIASSADNDVDLAVHAEQLYNFGTTFTLNTEGLLDVLSIDFARALKELAAVMTDLKRLATLGDLPVSLEKDKAIRVRFPGVDSETVERLCDDLGVRRGVVWQDPEFDVSVGATVALRFPFAPDGKGDGAVTTLTSPGGSARSNADLLLEDDYLLDEFEENPWLPSPELDGYGTMPPSPFPHSGEHCSEDFEGFEGIYRFLEECDRARGRF